MKTMDIYAKPGTRVQYAFADNGLRSDQRDAKQHLLLGNVYTVDHTDLGDFETRIWLKEVPNVHFNSSLFSDIPPNEPAEKWLEEQFEKFDFEGLGPEDKSEIYAVFMNNMREATYELFEEQARHHDLICSQGEKLRAIVNLVRGEPEPDTMWSTHDAHLLVGDVMEAQRACVQALTTLKKFVQNVTLKAVIDEALAACGPRHCPNCDKTDVTSSMETEEFGYGAAPETVQLKAEVRVFSCYDCGEKWCDHTAEVARSVAVNEYRKRIAS